MDIQDIRRANLRRWLDTHSAPIAEKSLFSQLKSGVGSFGERVARRLERTYGMGDGFLDRDNNQANTSQFPPLSDEARDLVYWVERLDGAGGAIRKIFVSLTTILQVAESIHESHNSNAVQQLLKEAADFENAAGRTERRGAKTNASSTRERKGRK
ncbi:hypothetical protein [Paraburkholderia kururiensis]|uniref:hypothetical protein n=1 Tax=Paraburkholderia kururiensis TaxID=984307 RepID=UPI001268066F|nr:hypothetical protein [Paraburkholderia kururiensis]